MGVIVTLCNIISSHPLIHTFLHLPHDYGNQPHDGFIETVEEVLQGLSLFPHAPDDQTEAHGEHHQAKSIDSINHPWHWNHLFPGYLLAPIDCEYCVIHCHLHTYHSLGILCLKLDFKKRKRMG